MTETASAGVAAAPRAPRRTSGLMQILRESAFLVLVALAASLAVKTFVVQPFEVPSESMDPTLQIGDRIMVGRMWPRPLSVGRGDIIVFTDPSNWLEAAPQPADATAISSMLRFVGLVPYNRGKHLVKRVIGLAGDVVECTPEGKMHLNGANLDEPYLKGVAPCDQPFREVVPSDCLWVMGDNRPNSADSRFHTSDRYGGCVPLTSVVGRVVGIAWPLKRIAVRF